MHGFDTSIPQFAMRIRCTRIVATPDIVSEILHVTSHQLKKKKRIDCLVPTCSPPNPTTHHTIHSFFSLFGRSLSLLFSFSFSFSVNTTHIHTLLSLTLPLVHSSSSPLPFFPAKSLENPQEHHTFT